MHGKHLTPHCSEHLSEQGDDLWVLISSRCLVGGPLVDVSHRYTTAMMITLLCHLGVISDQVGAVLSYHVYNKAIRDGRPRPPRHQCVYQISS